MREPEKNWSMSLSGSVYRIVQCRGKFLFLTTTVVLAGLLWGCRDEKSQPARAPSTIEMAQRLDSIAQQAKHNPRRSLYVNEARAAWIQGMKPPSNLRQWVDYKRRLANELLRAGKNERAIEHYTELLDFAKKRGAPASFRTAVKARLAISHLRRGEMRNCVQDPNPQRCLLPLEEEGVYEYQESAQEAVSLYKEILREDPDDLNSQWLLNVASMTVGAYPEEVPSQWRVPMGFLKDTNDFPRFPNVARDLGVDVMGLSGGTVVDDFSGNGHLDIMASSWGLQDQVRYFENTGDGTFVDRTEEAGLKGLVGGLNMKQADYNGDGHLDVLILRGAWYPTGHPNSLLRNDGDGTFTDVTVQAGLDAEHPTQTAAWGDYNNDGHLDLFIGNESSTEEGDNQWVPIPAGRHPAELYRNNGDGTFTNVASEVGLDVVSYIKGVQWGDINNDGNLDLYISSWNAPNRLYRNEGPGKNSTWQFTDITEEAGVAEPVESFPTWFWDVDNDGYVDLFVSGWRASAGDMAAEALGTTGGDTGEAVPPRLYHNNGDGTFTDVTEEAGLEKVLYSMGSNFGDLDNDGRLDFYVGTGDPDFRTLMPNRMFRNTGDLEFEEVTAPAGTGHLQKGHAVSFGDLDRDGDQDIYAVMGGAFEGDVFHNVLFENPGFDHEWITLRLEGTTSNRSAIGARIKVVIEEYGTERSIYRTVGSGGSFGASSLQQEIGLGQADSLLTVEVTWPASGTVQQFSDLAMNQIVRIKEGQDTPIPLDGEVVEFDTETLRGQNVER